MEIFENMSFDEERALYGRRGLTVKNCAFDGPADGESAFKECADVHVSDSFFNLRYPFWHVRTLEIRDCEMTKLCRAAVWYSENIGISGTKMYGIKALRECRNIDISDCDIISPEFGWSAKDIKMSGCTAESEYFMLRAENITFSNVHFRGKYSFQYIKNAVFDNCTFDTKDAFWHAENVTVKNSTVKGEYLAWYSDGLTLENCKISGTQPFCYCRRLRLADCEMTDADLCFEKSEAEADVTAPVISIKNPLAGTIRVPAVGEIIRDDAASQGKIIVAGKISDL